MRVHAVGLRAGRDATANAALVRDALAAAAADGADLVVLPEYAAAFDPGGVGAELAEPLDGGFVAALRAMAHELGVTVVAGTAVPDGPDNARAANVVVAVGPDGELAGTYRKVHLYDAFGHRESDRLVAGDPSDAPLVVRVADLSVGVLTCYDLRFPEAARRLVDAGADVIVVPAAWAAGEGKADHWETLLRARAIENTCAVVASAQQGPGVVGDAMVVSADGVVLARAGGAAAPVAAVADVRASDVAATRTRNPSLANRRYDVVPRADVDGDAPAPRGWDRLYAVGVGAAALLALALVLAPRPVLGAFDLLLFGGPGPATGAGRDHLAFVHQVLGAVLLGWAVLLAALAPALRRREPRAWAAAAASLAVWYVADTTSSLVAGFPGNAGLNTVLALVLGGALVGMRGRPRGGDERRRQRPA